MKSLVFTVKTITPTFMGGGDGKFDGIRIPEIKGMMRWWFRALAGSFVGDKFEKLRQIEGDLFGIAEDKKNSHRSKFKLSVENECLGFISKNSNGESLNGYTYLGIGNVIFKYDSNSRNFIPNPDKADKSGNVLINANSTFDLKFLFYPPTKDEEINLIAGSFYLATALGGFGLRARKCFGSWQIVKNEDKESLLKFSPTDYNKKGIIKNIDKLKEILHKKINSSISAATTYPAFDNSQFVFEAIETNKTDYKSILNEFGKLYRGFRVCAETPKPGLPRRGIHTSDFDFLRRASNPQNCKEIKEFNNYKVRNALFGLNIVYPQLNKQSLQLEISKDNETQVLRRASPVWFSVKEINGKLNLHIVLFKSQFMPENSKVVFDKKEITAEDYSLIENSFIPYINRTLGGKNG